MSRFYLRRSQLPLFSLCLAVLVGAAAGASAQAEPPHPSDDAAAEAQEPSEAAPSDGMEPSEPSEPAAHDDDEAPQAEQPLEPEQAPQAEQAEEAPQAEQKAISDAAPDAPADLNGDDDLSLEEEPQEEEEEEGKEKKRSFLDRLKLSGYTQLRYNGIPTPRSNPDLINQQGDRSIGGGNGFAIRRARLVLQADLHHHIDFYFQVDVVSMAGGTMHTLSLRDLYFDFYLDKNREFRVRPGQSKVPFGFENLQSSSRRLALDRNDALNSAVKDERDLGVFFYYTPRSVQAVHQEIREKRLKGTGDYGLVALGVYNGQTANQPEIDGNFHVIGRVAYPFRLGSQLLEVSGGGYWGRYTVRTENQGGTSYRLENDDPSIVDSRGYLAFMLYPQPFGIQFEGNLGTGPSQGPRGADDRTLITSRRLIGGAAQIMYKIDDPFGTISIIPFFRAAYYDGGKKSTVNAPHYLVKELEIGVEWQIIKQIELTLAYDIVERTSDVFPYDEESGHVARVQLQVNYP